MISPPEAWQSNLSEQHIRKIMTERIKGSVWEDIWASWAKIYFIPQEEITNVKEILNQKLHFNTCVQQGIMPFRVNETYAKGITKVKDIYNSDQKRLFTYE